jgi:hypothetical protein
VLINFSFNWTVYSQVWQQQKRNFFESENLNYKNWSYIYLCRSCDILRGLPGIQFNCKVISKKTSSLQGIVRPPMGWSYPYYSSGWLNNSWNDVRLKYDTGITNRLLRQYFSVDNLGVQYVLGTGKYMGLPSTIGRSKKAMFNFIMERVWRKINSSSSKCLSRTRLEVLIKSVLQSIVWTFFSSFLHSDEIEEMLNSCWWGHSSSRNKGIHWFSWEKLSMHKLGALCLILKALHLNYSKPDIFLMSGEVCLGS